MHTLMPAVLLRMTSLDALDGDAQTCFFEKSAGSPFETASQKGKPHRSVAFRELRGLRVVLLAIALDWRF
jgi:hypothetical protein